MDESHSGAPAAPANSRVDSPSSARDRRPRPSGDSLIAVAVTLVCSAIAWLRVPETARETIWAEDGRVFLWDVFFSPAWSTLLRTYDGYVHLVPRLVAEAVVLTVPPAGYALAVSAVSCVLVGCTAGLVYVCASTLTGSRWIRLGFASITVLVPSVALEVLGNLANLHWFALWLMPWLLFHRPASRLASIGFGAVALACSLTEIQTAFFLPLALWRWRERSGWAVRVALLFGVTFQLLGAADRPERTPPLPPVGDFIAGFLVNAVMTPWWGSAHTITWSVRVLGWGAAAMCLIPSVAAFVLVLRRGDRVQRLAAVVFPLASGVVWCAALYFSRPEADWSRPDAESVRELPVLRYAVVPSMYLMAGIVLACTVLRWRPLSRAITAALAVPLALVVVTSFVPVTVRSAGPTWPPESTRGREQCLEDDSAAYVDVPITPHGWTSRVPCDVLEGSAPAEAP